MIALIGEGGIEHVSRAVAVGFMLLVSIPLGAQEVQDEWDVADRAIPRLGPSQFPELPAAIRQDLETRGCTIPVREPREPWQTRWTNVAQGEYRQRGQEDWAVLCSINRVSRILVYWNGDVSDVAMLAERPDRLYVELNASGPQFARVVATADRNRIRSQWKETGSWNPVRRRWEQTHDLPETVHEGINDAIFEKASVIHYYLGGQWFGWG